MPAPRTTRDLERPFGERERSLVLNRRGPGRGTQSRVNVSRAVQRLGEFVRGSAGSRRSGGRPGGSVAGRRG